MTIRRGLYLRTLLLPQLQCNAQVDGAPLLIGHLRPARDLLEGAVAAAAYIVPQRRGAVPDTGRIRSDFKREGRSGVAHAADYTGFVASTRCEAASSHIGGGGNSLSVGAGSIR